MVWSTEPNEPALGGTGVTIVIGSPFASVHVSGILVAVLIGTATDTAEQTGARSCRTFSRELLGTT